MAFNILRHFQSIIEPGLRKTGTLISRWTKSSTHTPVLGTIADLTRSQPQLVAENLLLRQQLSILNGVDAPIVKAPETITILSPVID